MILVDEWTSRRAAVFCNGKAVAYGERMKIMD